MQVSQTDRLHELISERFEVVQHLLSLTEAHAATVGNEDLAVTMSILGRKESLIDRLRMVHQELDANRDAAPPSRVWRDAGLRLETQRLADQSDEMLRKILEMDGQTLQTMQEHRDAIAAQLHHGNDTLSAQQAYSTQHILSESLLDVSDL